MDKQSRYLFPLRQYLFFIIFGEKTPTSKTFSPDRLFSEAGTFSGILLL